MVSFGDFINEIGAFLPCWYEPVRSGIPEKRPCGASPIATTIYEYTT